MIPGIDSPGLVSCIHEVSNVCVRGDSELGQVLHVGAHQRVLSYPQVPFVLRVEQISDSLAVDLHITDLEIIAKLMFTAGAQYQKEAKLNEGKTLQYQTITSFLFFYPLNILMV